jgi:hypothetical protein
VLLADAFVVGVEFWVFCSSVSSDCATDTAREASGT